MTDCSSKILDSLQIGFGRKPVSGLRTIIAQLEINFSVRD